MADGEEMDHVSAGIKSVDHPVIADAQPVTVVAGQVMMGKRFKAKSHFVDFRLDSVANGEKQPEKRSIKPGVINLECSAHADSRLACAGTKAGLHFAF